MANALFTLAADGGDPLDPGVAMADDEALAFGPSGTYDITAELDSTAGLYAVVWSITTADPDHFDSLPTVTPAAGAAPASCEFSVPKTGGAWILRCLGNNEAGDATLDRKLAVKVRYENGQQTFAVGETTEASSAHGYAKALHDAITSASATPASFSAPTTVTTTPYAVTASPITTVYAVSSGVAAITMTLPANPTAGDSTVIKDYGGNASVNNITISGNGRTIDGASSVTIDENYASLTLVFRSPGWMVI